MDLSGNRYLLKSKRAISDELKPETIYMNDVSSVFYFKEAITNKFFVDFISDEQIIELLKLESQYAKKYEKWENNKTKYLEKYLPMAIKGYDWNGF